jgi:hypothetical protein
VFASGRPREYIACALKYKKRCPGIIFKDFEALCKQNKRHPLKRRKELCTRTGVCGTCANAKQRDERNEKRRIDRTTVYDEAETMTILLRPTKIANIKGSDPKKVSDLTSSVMSRAQSVRDATDRKNQLKDESLKI